MSDQRVCDNCGKVLTPTRFTICIPLGPLDRLDRFREALGGQIQLHMMNGAEYDLCNKDCLVAFIQRGPRVGK